MYDYFTMTRNFSIENSYQEADTFLGSTLVLKIRCGEFQIIRGFQPIW